MLKNKNGITLIAMVITIIVMLILAGISIATLTGENGVINRTTKAKTATRAGEIKDLLRLEATNNKAAEYQNEKQKTRSEFITELVAEGKLSEEEVEELQSAATPTITIGGIALDFSILPESVQVWTQNGTSVTDGKINLTVGTQVTGYSVTGHTDLNWYVLGAKDGKLLITTNTCPEGVELRGTAGFTNADGTGCPWVTILNTAAAKYSDGDMAESTRTIDYDDIKRIDSNPTHYNKNVGQVYEYGNKVTYKLKNEKLYYKGTKQPIPEEGTDQDGICSGTPGFKYWNGTGWTPLGDGQSTTLDCTYESYDASSLNSSAKTLLFAHQDSFWVGTPYVKCEDDRAWYGMYYAFSTYVYDRDLYGTWDGSITRSWIGLLPVVSLKSSVKVSDTGVLTK